MNTADLVEMMRQCRKQGGLVFVPDVWGALEKVGVAPGKIRRMLREAYEQGLIELRPEGGLGRLTPAERSRCLLRDDGTPLSYARVLV